MSFPMALRIAYKSYLKVLLAEVSYEFASVHPCVCLCVRASVRIIITSLFIVDTIVKYWQNTNKIALK